MAYILDIMNKRGSLHFFQGGFYKAMTDKFDYKKEFKDLYIPKKKATLIDVPAMNFITVDGKGLPASEDYENAMQCLYGLSYTIKMSKMSGQQPVGYFEYVVPPLEGLWCCQDGPFDFGKPEQWIWTSMIRQPEFVTDEVFEWAKNELAKKKPELDLNNVRFQAIAEGLCVQIMHKGPYSDEPTSIMLMDEYMEHNNLKVDWESGRRHHEIYLSDPRRTKPENIKTVLRHPVRKAG